MKNIVVYIGLVLLLVGTGVFLWQSEPRANDSVVLGSENVSVTPSLNTVGAYHD